MEVDLQETIVPFQRQEQPVLRIRLVEQFAALQAHQIEWNALVARSTTNTIFQTFEWHASWWKTFGEEAHLLVLLTEAGGVLVGIAPCMLVERQVWGRRQRLVKFIGAGDSDYCDFIVDQAYPEALPLMWQWLVEHVDWELLHLSHIPEASPMVRGIPTFFDQRGYLTDVRVLYEAPTCLFGDPVADQKLVKKKSLKRHYNYFCRSGQLEFKNYTTAEDIDDYLDRFFEQHIQRRAQTDDPSQFLDSRKRRFYKEMVQALAPTGWLRFSVLFFNQKPIAFHLGFEYEKRFIYYAPTFDVSHAGHGPGQVLLKYLLEYALEQAVEEVDFSIGEEEYKYRFANHVRLTYAVRVFRHAIPYQIHRFLYDTRAVIKGSPKLMKLGYQCRKHWRSMGQHLPAMYW